MSSNPSPTAGLQASDQVSHGLNLHLTLADPTQMPLLMEAIASKADETRAALRMLNFVHFARFLPTPDNSTLQVITSFDGPLEAYALDFVIAIDPIFDAILSFVKDAPPLPVKDHPEEFFQFVKLNNRVTVQAPALTWDDYPVFSAYPDRTVIDILGPRTSPPPVRAVPPAVVDAKDVQGNVLRGYRAARARHYSLRIQDGPAARALLTRLVDGADDDLPQVTSAETWTEKPLCMLNLSLSATGLRALGLPAGMLARFSEAFLQGPAQRERAINNGDVDASAPQHWEIGGPASEVHLLVSLFSNAEEDSQRAFQRGHEQLLAAFTRHRLTLVHQHEAWTMPRGQVHFGYVDGIAQPQLAGVDQGEADDLQPLASVGEFLLGSNYTSVYGGKSLGGLPASLGQNGTYVALRVLEQDVAAFEQVLDRVSAQHGLDREWVAAKMMGRWRDGRPLALAPQGPGADGQPAPGGINAFDYAPSLAYPDQLNDHLGLHCPVGSHLRRMNPRSGLVAGQPYSRRIIRRGMPYGPVWTPESTEERRGLFGLFICADLSRQFEFLMNQWANSDSSASGIRGTQDPIIGTQSLGGMCRIPMPDGAAPLEFNLPRLVQTKGSLYLFMPGLNALRWLARGEGFDDSAASRIGPAQWLSEAPTVQTRSRLAPELFDPLDPDFLVNPYPYYALFRRHSPVVRVARNGYESFWVFSHELCARSAADSFTFLKKPTSVSLSGRGLFFMDPPQHQLTRQALDPLFTQAIANISATAQTRSAQALDAMQAMPGPIDLISSYATPVTRDVFMQMFGLPEAMWQSIGALALTMLDSFNPMLPLDNQTPGYAAAAQLLGYFGAMSSQCPAHPPANPNGLFCSMQTLINTPALDPTEAAQTALDFALGGFLSSSFLVGTAARHLLSRPEVLNEYLRGDTTLKLQAMEELRRFDAPFQMADRYASTDIHLAGVHIPRNACVTLVYGSANRDEAVFGPDAERLDIHRVIEPGQNLVFGRGEHQCIGAPMANQVVPALVDGLLQRFPALALVPGATSYMTDPYFRGLSRLPVTRGSD